MISSVEEVVKAKEVLEEAKLSFVKKASLSMSM